MKLINWLKETISINEAKTSSMILVFLLYSIYGIYFYATHHELTDNYVLIMQTLIVGISSVNVTQLIKGKKKDDPQG
jgi:hypothetical protein